MYLFVQPFRVSSKSFAVIVEVQIAARDADLTDDSVVPDDVAKAVELAVRNKFTTLPHDVKPAKMAREFHAVAVESLRLRPTLAIHAIQIKFPLSESRLAYYGPNEVVTVVAGECVMNPTQKSEPKEEARGTDA